MYFMLLAWVALFTYSLSHYFVIRKKEGKIFPKGILLDVLFPGVLSGLIAASVFSFIAPTEEKLTSTIDIVSIKETYVGEGSWFLLAGESKTTPYYEYRAKFDSQYRLGRVNALSDNIIITETNTGQPVLKIYKTFVQEDYRNWALFSSFEKAKYFFYVPEGTFKKEFKLG